MRNRTSKFSGVMWALAIVAAIAGYPAMAAQTSTAADDPEINWLFVANATSGTFDGKTLTMHNVPPPLMFSDRPHRVWGHMALSELLPKVEEGANSFIVNLPNAVLSTFREGELPTEATVVLHQPTLDGASLSFPVDVLDGSIPATFGPASLFIDGIHHHGHAGAFIVGAAVANANNNNDNETVVVREPTYVYSANPTPTAPVSSTTSVQSRLAEVKNLFDQGLISEEEYAKKREQILAAM